jgi:hypothetical protein
MLKPNTTALRVMRLLADALQRRAVAPHIFESADKARAHLREFEGQCAS